jgi:hypothetical protein
MRPLWQIERAVLEITVEEYPISAEALRLQLASAQVESFENSGAGFFSNLFIDPAAPTVAERSPLAGAYGSVLGIDHGMGFIVFLESGRISFIEGYTHGDVSTADFDFKKAVFGLTPWGARPNQGA